MPHHDRQRFISPFVHSCVYVVDADADALLLSENDVMAKLYCSTSKLAMYKADDDNGVSHVTTAKNRERHTSKVQIWREYIRVRSRVTMRINRIRPFTWRKDTIV